MEAQSKPSNGMAIASLVLGIVAIVFAVIPGFGAYVAVPLGIVGLILAIIAKKKGKSTAATAGLVLSIISIALGVILYIACIACVAGINAAAQQAVQDAANSIS